MRAFFAKAERTLALAFGIAAVATPMFSRQQGAARPSFEVASIKPNTSGDNRVMIMNQPGGRFVSTGVTLKMLMTSAYRVRDFQILGGPDWITTDRWDIQARAEEGAASPAAFPADPNVPNPMSLMTQSLLEDRFHLKSHRETRELPVYELTVTKSGSKVTLSEDQTPFKPPERGAPPIPPPQRGGPMPRGSARMGRGEFQGTAIPFQVFVNTLAQQLGRTVVDKTGLMGLYDIHLKWTPDFAQGAGPLGPPPAGVEPPPDPSGPSIFTAVEEQLGLKLESSKGPVEVILIDGVEKPSEN